MFRWMLRSTVIPILGLSLCLVLGPKSGLAGPVITFTFSGTGSGTIGGTTFTSEMFDITIMGDTNNVQAVPGFPNSIRILSNSASIDIAGSTSSITPQLSVFRNTGGFVGLALPPSTDLIRGPSGTVFGTWDMTTSIGPITSTATFANWNSVNIATSDGQLIFNDVDELQTTFAATVVPEPSAALFLGLAFCIFGWVRYLRR